MHQLILTNIILNMSIYIFKNVEEAELGIHLNSGDRVSGLLFANDSVCVSVTGVIWLIFLAVLQPL